MEAVDNFLSEAVNILLNNRRGWSGAGAHAVGERDMTNGGQLGPPSSDSFISPEKN